MGGQARVQAGQRRGRGLRGAPRKNGDGASVGRSGRERAANSELEPRGPVLAREHQNVDHLPRSLRSSVALGDLCPELIEASRPRAPLALLRQRDRAGQAAGLALQELEVVVKDRAVP